MQSAINDGLAERRRMQEKRSAKRRGASFVKQAVVRESIHAVRKRTRQSSTFKKVFRVQIFENMRTTFSLAKRNMPYQKDQESSQYHR